MLKQSSLPSAKAELDELNSTASGLLGLSFSPNPSFSPLPSTRPVAIPRKGGRRGSESAAAAGSFGASGGSFGGSLTSGMEKKKSGAGSGASKRETLGTRSSGRTVIPPKVFEFRPTPDSSTTSPSPASFSSPHTAASASLLSPRSLPAHVSILGTNGEDDGEILEDEMKDLKNGKGGKRRSASVFRCESCSKIYRHPSCLVKHRWQHSPHWQESSKLPLSKHQQVQLLEAATILVHLAPNSLPEDKSLWPASVSPASHPMPSISFMDSRQRSKATSTHASNLLRQHSNQSTVSAPMSDTTAHISVNSRSSEEVMSSSSSPNSSAEPESDSDDILDDEDEDAYERGAADSGYGGSLVKREGHGDPMAMPPPPPPMSYGGGRRTSFGSLTGLMGRTGLGSAALSSSSGTPSPFLGGTPPSSFPISHTFTNPSSYSSSPNFASSGSPAALPPYGTSPAPLLLRSSSLRGTGDAFDEEDDEEEVGRYQAATADANSFVGASLLARAAAALLDQGRMEMLAEEEGRSGEEVEEGDWNTMDMDM